MAPNNSQTSQPSGGPGNQAPQGHGPNRRHTRASARVAGDAVLVQGLDQRGQPPPEAFQVLGVPERNEEEAAAVPGDTIPPSTPTRASATPSPSASSVFSNPYPTPSESPATSLSSISSSSSWTWTSTYTSTHDSLEVLYSPSVSRTMSLTASDGPTGETPSDEGYASGDSGSEDHGPGGESSGKSSWLALSA